MYLFILIATILDDLMTEIKLKWTKEVTSEKRQCPRLNLMLRNVKERYSFTESYRQFRNNTTMSSVFNYEKTTIEIDSNIINV